jgi:hypothetical protein
MPFTKAQILAAPAAQVDDYVAESVMQWSRAASVKLGTTSTDTPTLVENTGNSPVSRVDNTQVAGGGPNYQLRAKPPDFSREDWPQKVIHKMALRGFSFEYKVSGSDAAAVFYTGARPGSPDYVVLPDPGDAVRRAALVAVQ